MFYGCKSLSNISFLENWNISKDAKFTDIFFGCPILKDKILLENRNKSQFPYFLLKNQKKQKKGKKFFGFI